jgi:hypothetical protein
MLQYACTFAIVSCVWVFYCSFIFPAIKNQVPSLVPSSASTHKTMNRVSIWNFLDWGSVDSKQANTGQHSTAHNVRTLLQRTENNSRLKLGLPLRTRSCGGGREGKTARKNTRRDYTFLSCILSDAKLSLSWRSSTYWLRRVCIASVLYFILVTKWSEVRTSVNQNVTDLRKLRKEKMFSVLVYMLRQTFCRLAPYLPFSTSLFTATELKLGVTLRPLYSTGGASFDFYLAAAVDSANIQLTSTDKNRGLQSYLRGTAESVTIH